MIKLREAKQEDKKEFSELMLQSAPYFSVLFGKKIDIALQKLFVKRNNLFSFELTTFAEVNGKKAGMILSYDWKTKKRLDLKTGALLLKGTTFYFVKNFPLLLKFNSVVGKIYKGDYYISNIAVFPDFRRRGIGKRLLEKAEERAKTTNCKRIILDVENNNTIAIAAYSKLGYKKMEEKQISLSKNKKINFVRMAKEIQII